MKKYIGFLSVVYIIVTIVKLKDTRKSFMRYKEEFTEMKQQLKLVSYSKNPFIMMKFTSFLFYFFLILYYVANLVLFNDFLVINIISYILIAVGLFKLVQKLAINSVADFEEMVQASKQDYRQKRKFNFLLGLIEFAYAFNALSLVSFYY